MDSTHGRGLAAEERRARRAEMHLLGLPDTLTAEQKERFLDTGDLPLGVLPCQCRRCEASIKYRPLPARFCAECREYFRRLDELSKRLRRGAECRALAACEERVTSVPGGR